MIQPPSVICCQSVLLCPPGNDLAEVAWAKAGPLKVTNRLAIRGANFSGKRLEIAGRTRLWINLFIWGELLHFVSANFGLKRFWKLSGQVSKGFLCLLQVVEAAKCFRAPEQRWGHPAVFIWIKDRHMEIGKDGVVKLAFGEES